MFNAPHTADRDGAIDYGYGYAPGNNFAQTSSNPNETADITQRTRRASIQAIMADKSLTPLERRRSIQGTMDGRRKSTGFLSTDTNECTDKTPMEMEKKRPECTHYERNCTIIATCCGLAFGCRICHDEYPDLPPITNKSCENESGNDAESHSIDRYNIAEIICRDCYTRQSSKTNRCINCNAQFGEYHCAICNLWMSAEEMPYHCPDCGFCRLGGAHNYEHCKECGICIDKGLYPVHECKQGKYMSNCPVCQEDLFSSRAASHELPCGHAIHWHCYQKLASFDSRCPVCKKTSEDPQDMAETWQAMAMTLELQPVPSELAKVVDISCNDCEQRSINSRWHILGVQCRHCNSFNTIVDQVRFTGDEALAFFDNPDHTELEAEIAEDPEVNEVDSVFAMGIDLSDSNFTSSNTNNFEEQRTSAASSNNIAPIVAVDEYEHSSEDDEIYIPPRWSIEEQRDSSFRNETTANENCNESDSLSSSSDCEMTSDGIYIPTVWRFDIPVGGEERSVIS